VRAKKTLLCTSKYAYAFASSEPHLQVQLPTLHMQLQLRIWIWIWIQICARPSHFLVELHQRQVLPLMPLQSGHADAVAAVLAKLHIGAEPTDGSGKDKTDAHVWLEDDDGIIVDPTPPAMTGERQYRPFKRENQRRIWNEWKQELQQMDKATRSDMRKALYQSPAPHHCGFNAYAYWFHHKLQCKIVVGALGFKQGDGSVFWEFG
jgi:hypothetical protein